MRCLGLSCSRIQGGLDKGERGEVSLTGFPKWEVFRSSAEAEIGTAKHGTWTASASCPHPDTRTHRARCSSLPLRAQRRRRTQARPYDFHSRNLALDAIETCVTTGKQCRLPPELKLKIRRGRCVDMSKSLLVQGWAFIHHQNEQRSSP